MVIPKRRHRRRPLHSPLHLAMGLIGLGAIWCVADMVASYFPVSRIQQSSTSFDLSIVEHGTSRAADEYSSLEGAPLNSRVVDRLSDFLGSVTDDDHVFDADDQVSSEEDQSPAALIREDPLPFLNHSESIEALETMRKDKIEQAKAAVAKEQAKPYFAPQPGAPMRHVDPAEVDATVERLLKDNPACFDKGPLLTMVLSSPDSPFLQAPGSLLCPRLPTMHNITQLYSSQPIIYGLETCQAYRDLLKPEANNGKQLEPMPRIAGLYHSGTNAMARTLDNNLKELLGQSYDVPWGKHLPPNPYRTTNRHPPNNREDPTRVMPIVIVRDPFWWMQSMCRVRYDGYWEKAENYRCPNLVRSAHNSSTYEVVVHAQQTNYEKTDNYTSLAHLWSDWNRQWLKADGYPRLMIRFEDTLYRLPQVVESIRQCVGAQSPGRFIYLTSKPKSHGNPTDFVKALARYASWQGRHRGLNEADRQYAQSALDPDLMRVFGYHPAPLEVDPADLEGKFSGWGTQTQYQKRPRVRSVAGSDVVEIRRYRKSLKWGST